MSNKIGYLHGVKMIYLFKALNYMAAVIVNTHERKKPLMPFQSSFILWKTKCIKKIAHKKSTLLNVGLDPIYFHCMSKNS